MEDWKIWLLVTALLVLGAAVVACIVYFLCCRKSSKRKHGILTGNRGRDVESGRRITYSVEELDLHGYYVKDALLALEKFIQRTETQYKNKKREEGRYVHVITGRGLHSQDGVPKIKPAVVDFMTKRKFQFKWDNPGMMIVDLRR